MCHKCFLRFSRERDFLGIDSRSRIGNDPNELYQSFMSPCRHDKKRLLQNRGLSFESPRERMESLLRTDQISGEDPAREIMELLLEYGETFPIAEPAPKWKAPEPYWKCFNTAYGVYRSCNRYLYAEGIATAFTEVLWPMLHAWNIDASTGLLHDFTWPMAPWNQYLGIVFDLDWTAENCAMPHGIFHPINWEYNRGPVTEYLKTHTPGDK